MPRESKATRRWPADSWPLQAEGQQTGRGWKSGQPGGSRRRPQPAAATVLRGCGDSGAGQDGRLRSPSNLEQLATCQSGRASRRTHHCTTDALESSRALLGARSTVCSSLPSPQDINRRAPAEAGTAASSTGSPSIAAGLLQLVMVQEHRCHATIGQSWQPPSRRPCGARFNPGSMLQHRPSQQPCLALPSAARCMCSQAATMLACEVHLQAALIRRAAAAAVGGRAAWVPTLQAAAASAQTRASESAAEPPAAAEM